MRIFMEMRQDTSITVIRSLYTNIIIIIAAQNICIKSSFLQSQMS